MTVGWTLKFENVEVGNLFAAAAAPHCGTPRRLYTATGCVDLWLNVRLRKTLMMAMGAFSTLVTLLASAVLPVGTSASPSLLQSLPKSFNPGNAKVVFIKDRMSVLPKGFTHTGDGMAPRKDNH
jgi:hypothetical protein